MKPGFNKDLQYYKFCLYGFLKNLRFFEPFLILFFLEQGISYVQIGTLYAIREFGRNILEIPSGIVADVLGRRKTMISAFSSYLMSFFIFYFTENYSAYIIAMIFFSFGDAFRTGTHKAMIFEYLKMKGWTNQKTYYYGHTRSWSQIGSAISSVLAALLVFYTGEYSVIFIFSTIPYFIDLILMISYPKELDGEIQNKGIPDIYHSFKNVISDLLITLKNRETLRAIGNLSFYSGYFKAVKDYLQPILQTFALSLPLFMNFEDKQRSALIIGIVYFFIYFLTSSASRWSGHFEALFSHLTKPLNILLYLGFLTGIACGIFYSLGIVFISSMLFMLIFIIENLRKPIGITFVSEKFNEEVQASALSTNSQFQTAISAVIALFIGFVAEEKGVDIALVVISGMMLILSPFVRVKKRMSV